MNAKFFLNLIKGSAFLALIMPFIVSTDYYFPYTGLKGVYFMALAEIAFFAWAILALKFKQYRPDFKNPIVFTTLFFLTVLFASAVFGANFSKSFWSNFERMGGVLMFFHLTAFFIVVTTVFKKPDWENFFSASVIVAAIVGVEALFNQTSAARGGGFFGNDSFLGTYLLFNIFIALYLFFGAAKNKKKKLICAATFLLLAFCLLIEGSITWRNAITAGYTSVNNFLIDIFNSGARAAKISLLVGVSLLGIFWLVTRRKLAAKITGIFLLTAGIFGAIATIFLIARPESDLYQKIEAQFSRGTVHGRIVVWEIAWKDFLDRPLLGWGPENFDLAFARRYNPCLGSPGCGGEIWYDRAHNMIFNLLAETGAFGLLTYLAIFAAAIFVLWRGYFNNKFGFAEAGVFTSLLAAYFLQNLTVFDMTVSYLMFFSVLGFVAACDCSERKINDDLPQSVSFKNKSTIAILVVFAICFFNFVLGPWVADAYILQTVQTTTVRSPEGEIISRKENNPFGSPQRLQYYEKTFAATPMGKYQTKLFFARMWLEKLEDEPAIAQMDKQQITDEFEFIAAELQKSVAESPLSFKSWLKLGEVYNKWSLFDKSKLSEAETALQQALRLSPNNQLPYLYLAQTRLYQLRIDDALDLAWAAYDLYPQNVQVRQVINQIEEIKSKSGETQK